MNINRENYQEYAMEWLEGTLGTADHAAFVRFLDANPDIRYELEDLTEAIQIEPEAKSGTPDFSSLKQNINLKSPNHHNINEFIIARMDGELNEVSCQQLEAWLLQNPEYLRDVAALEATRLQPDQTVTFSDKGLLQQQIAIRGGRIQKEQLEELIVASMEGELSDADQQELEVYLAAHPEAADMQIAFRFTRLSPDYSLVFSDKASLKQKVVVPLQVTRTVWLRGLAVAASLALLAGLFLMGPDEETVVVPPTTEIASQVPGTALQAPETEIITAEYVAPQRAAGSRKNIQTQPASGEVTLASNDAHPADYMAIPKQELRPTGSLMQPMNPVASIQPNRQSLAYQSVPEPSSGSKRRLTVNEFPVEQVRYFTGGGNERPGLLAELTIPRLIELTNPYERINSAGQQLITRWNRWKEQAMDEVVPFR